ncbi:hypothetical protein Cfor_01122, partial [Coptotermes formosanus]
MARVRYTIEEYVYLVQMNFKYESARKCRRKFRCQLLGEPLPSRQTIQYLVNKLTTGSLVDKKPDKKGTVLTEEKLEEIGARLETSARKSLRRLAQACFESICTKVTKLLTLRPYKTTVDHSLRFSLRGEVNSQNNKYRSAENPRLIHEFPLRDGKICLACDECTAIYFNERANADRCVKNILRSFLAELTEGEKLYCYFQQDSATDPTAHVSLEALRKVFDGLVISRGLWPPRSPDLTPCDFYLWESLKDKV